MRKSILMCYWGVILSPDPLTFLLGRILTHDSSQGIPRYFLASPPSNTLVLTSAPGSHWNLS